MKKFLMLLLGAVLLVACSAEKSSKDEGDKVIEPKSEPTQEELNEQLREEAVQADFVELKSSDAELDKKVFATGGVSMIEEGETFNKFMLTTNEDDRKGIYTIKDVLKTSKYKEGDVVTIYGTFDGKDELGFPSISSTVIELNK